MFQKCQSSTFCSYYPEGDSGEWGNLLNFINLWQNNYPMQMLINRCVSPDRGAPPQSIIRMFPPSTERIFLKMTTSQSNFSTPQAPSQLPSIAASRRLYAILKSFLAKPPFSSTCDYNNKKGELINHLIYPIQENAQSKMKELIVIPAHTFFETPSRTRSKIAGTAVISVGPNADASPFVPFLILLEVSVKVCAEP